MVIVVKAGGRALEANWDEILKSIAARASVGVVFVHGGGDTVTRFEKLIGIEPQFIVSPQGIRSRFTDEREIEVYNMVMSGKLNKEAVARLNSLGVKAVGLSGVDAQLIRAERKRRVVVIDERGRRRVVEGGYTGKITSINSELLSLLLSHGYLIVVAPVALGTKGELLNVDADQAAASIASELRVERLILLTDVEGVRIDGRLVERLTAGEAREIQGKVGYGMNRKIMMCVRALEAGVKEAVISSGLVEDPVGASKNTGTHIFPE